MLTNSIPKALVAINDIPLLELIIRRLMRFGIKDIIINVHYMAAQIELFLEKNNNFGINIVISDEKEKVLETGGGLKKAQHFFDDRQPFLLCNTDILCDIDIHELQKEHLKNNAIATLAVQDRKTSRYFLFNEKMELCGWKNIKADEIKAARENESGLEMLAFSSFQILEPRIFDYLPKNKEVFSNVDFFLKVAETEIIKAYVHNANWLDVGTPENILQAELFLKRIDF